MDVGEVVAVVHRLDPGRLELADRLGRRVDRLLASAVRHDQRAPRHRPPPLVLVDSRSGPVGPAATAASTRARRPHGRRRVLGLILPGAADSRVPVHAVGREAVPGAVVHRKYSTLPCGPGQRARHDGAHPEALARPRPRRRRGPRTPAAPGRGRRRPQPSRSRPTSNCGLTRSRRSAPRRGDHGGQRGQHEREGDEGEVADDEPGRPGRRSSRRQVADVDALPDGDPGVGAQPRDELVVADVDRDDVRGAAPQQDVGEPAGGGAGVQAPAAPDDRSVRAPGRRARRRACARRARRIPPSGASGAGRPRSSAPGRAAWRSWWPPHPSTRTRPASTSSPACRRDRARPRRTSSVSSRARSGTVSPRRPRGGPAGRRGSAS